MYDRNKWQGFVGGLLLLRSNPSRQYSKILYNWGLRRRGKKMWKRRSEEKGVGFLLGSLFPTRKLEAVTQGGTSQTGG